MIIPVEVTPATIGCLIHLNLLKRPEDASNPVAIKQAIEKFIDDQFSSPQWTGRHKKHRRLK